MISRRHLLGAPAVAMAAQPAPKNIVIASSNGLRPCARAMEILKQGGDTLDAVIAGVNIQEEDPDDDSVGYGGLPNEEGVVELDACVMHGPTRRAGSVASVRGIKTPSKIAKLVMEQTDHIMLVGEGALRFAKAYGFREENLLTEKSRLAWLVWKRGRRDAGGHNNWSDGVDAPPGKPGAQLRRAFPEASEELLAYALDRAMYPPDDQLPGAERKRRDVGGDHHERAGVEDSGARRRFADYRRGVVCGSGHRRGGIHRAGRREYPRGRRAFGGGEHAPRPGSQGGVPRCVETHRAEFWRRPQAAGAVRYQFLRAAQGRRVRVGVVVEWRAQERAVPAAAVYGERRGQEPQ
jgi:hypothetical protein